jgi:hypothetical protein
MKNDRANTGRAVTRPRRWTGLAPVQSGVMAEIYSSAHTKNILWKEKRNDTTNTRTGLSGQTEACRLVPNITTSMLRPFRSGKQAMPFSRCHEKRVLISIALDTSDRFWQTPLLLALNTPQLRLQA